MENPKLKNFLNKKETKTCKGIWYSLLTLDLVFGKSISAQLLYVESAIRRIKTYGILKGTLLNTFTRIANQEVSVCVWLTNFQPALVPFSQQNPEESEQYFEIYGSNV